ncbi:MAG: hypothetical protein AAGG57_18515 [Pseudomonadota bacterium]
MNLPSFAWARPVTLKADDILNLPEYTFGLHTKKRGFVPITCAKDILTAIPQRDSFEALKPEMEAKHGTAATTPAAPDAADTVSEDRGEGGLGPAPEVEII